MIPEKMISCVISAVFASFCLLAGAASAQTADAQPGIRSAAVAEIQRDVRDLAPDLRPIDEDVANTALVFTNGSPRDLRVICVGFDSDGRVVGRTAVKVPANGTKYALASDLSNGADFVGNAQCSGNKTVQASAIFLGPCLTDLPVANVEHDGAGRIRFGLVATY